MFRYIASYWGLCFALLAGWNTEFISGATAAALSRDANTFYALPNQAQGTFVVAQDLHVSDAGGVWLHDIHGNVHYFDGRRLLLAYSALTRGESHLLAFAGQQFWTVVENEVFRILGDGTRESMLQLAAGTEIKRIGAYDEYLWLSDGKSFYTFDVASEELDVYPLDGLYQHNQSSQITINHAVKVGRRWVLATSSGSYLSQGRQFTHLTASKKNFNSKLHYSTRRNEILVGTGAGAVLVNLVDATTTKPFIGNSNVTAITENNDGYWVGTEQGLYFYSFASGKVVELANSVDGIPIGALKIHALDSDRHNGIWIATSRGVFYHSSFSQHFLRTVKDQIGNEFDAPGLGKVERSQDGTLWFMSENTLYRQTDAPSAIEAFPLTLTINDFALGKNVVWLATDTGLYQFDWQANRTQKVALSYEVGHRSFDHIEIDDAQTLWFSDGFYLFNYIPEHEALKSYGNQWPVSQYLPSAITGLEKMAGISLLVRTAHGVYIVKGDRIQFERHASAFGSSIDVAQGPDGAFWYASAYGVYKSIPRGNGFQRVELPRANALPACLIAEPHGVWLASSVGLTFYTKEGLIERHFGAPLGLINNEFVANSCPELNWPSNQLVLGSRYGVVQVDRQALLTSSRPDTQITLSQVKVNDRVISTGQTEASFTQLPYGSSVSMLVGVLPLSSNQNVFYRLGDSGEWQYAENGQVTLTPLCCNTVTLQLTNSKDGEVIQSVTLGFAKPWYFTAKALIAVLAIVIIMLAFLTYWHRYRRAQNKSELNSQLNSRTAKLNQATDNLLVENQLLARQIEVDKQLSSHWLLSIHAQLSKLVEPLQRLEPMTKPYLLGLFEDLESLSAIHRLTDNQTLPGFDLDLVIRTLVSVWQAPLQAHRVTLEYQGEANARIEVSHFNLDALLNTLLLNLVTRSHMNQTLTLTLRIQSGFVVLSSLDQGDSVKTGASDDLPDLLDRLRGYVEESGGEIIVFSSEYLNKIELIWPQATDSMKADAIDDAVTAYLEIHQSDDSHNECWLNKVINLVETHYADATFGTSLAAKKLYVSERSLQRRFKLLNEQTFTEYLTEVRLTKASQRLLAGEKIADVAFACGFNDASYFSLRFKQYFGTSPSKYVIDKHDELVN
ncbi:helix-turn-helix domain-containing protein [Vibrio sp. SM6]|uniref:Helix-turn-helix domain-containing protein n=1 Tax=Vibrio agarilyticus TaxID=2726741 RepID=A0A7X8TN12_9VIBR|nr:AraC family transcriptional regulator [Vibrio agarilyticus]NLS11569.1 helix-turn-helix domain-containing protein [Vibrio agarilyticus]